MRGRGDYVSEGTMYPGDYVPRGTMYRGGLCIQGGLCIWGGLCIQGGLCIGGGGLCIGVRGTMYLGEKDTMYRGRGTMYRGEEAYARSSYARKGRERTMHGGGGRLSIPFDGISNTHKMFLCIGAQSHTIPNKWLSKSDDGFEPEVRVNYVHLPHPFL